MNTFRYRALTTGGTVKKGVIDADSADRARQTLRDSNLAPLEVDAISKVGDQFTRLFSVNTQPVATAKQVALFTAQLSTMLGAGVPLSQALNFVALRSPRQVGALFHSLRGKVMEGESLAKSMSEYPGVFDTLYTASVEAGEQAGALDIVLEHLADYQESSNANQQQISSALLYPSILLVASLAVVTLLLASVMPGFIEIFEQNNQALPPITVFVVGTFDFIKLHGIWLFLLVLALVGLFRRAKQSIKVQLKYDEALLATPGIRAFIENRAAENIARTLYILTSSGMQLVDALKIATNVISNRVLHGQLTQTTYLVEQGTSFSQALSEASSMPAIFIQLVESGEASGKLDKTLKKTADILQHETQATLTTVVSLIEPIILILVSCLVFTIVIALMQPIFQLNSFI